MARPGDWCREDRESVVSGILACAVLIEPKKAREDGVAGCFGITEIQLVVLHLGNGCRYGLVHFEDTFPFNVGC